MYLRPAWPVALTARRAGNDDDRSRLAGLALPGAGRA